MARGIARSLRLNEDLVEAIALGHDLGHTPYGHAVEGLLNQLLEQEGGFLHNEQSIRVVELLEKKNGLKNPGLNLTWEVREGILKHTKDSSGICQHLEPDVLPSLEGQVVRIADKIAYVTHDFEDAYFSSGIFDELKYYGVLNESELDSVWERFNASKDWGVSSIINRLIQDVTEGTKKRIDELGIKSPEDGRKDIIVSFDKYEEDFIWLKNFVSKYVYESPIASIMDTKAKRIIEELFHEYLKNPKQLPIEHFQKYNNPRNYIELRNSYVATKNRALCDFLSGLTDRYAIVLYNKLFDRNERILSAK